MRSRGVLQVRSPGDSEETVSTLSEIIRYFDFKDYLCV